MPTEASTPTAARALVAALALLAGTAARAAGPEVAHPAADLEGALDAEEGPAREGSARDHRRYFEERYGPAPASALVRVQQAITRERDRVGPLPSQPGDGGLLSSLAVQGNAWVNLGPTGSSRDTPSIGAGHLTTQSSLINAIVVHPGNPDILYVADDGGGVWKTYDATAATPHWRPLTDTLGSMFAGALAMDPNSPEILYLGMGTYNRGAPGISYTRDGGATWKDPVFLTAQSGGVTSTALRVHDLKVDPNDSANVLAATDLGLFRSTDAGNTWAHVALTHGPGPAPARLDETWSVSWVGGNSWLLTGTQAVADASGTLTLSPGDFGLWRSDDGAATWSWVTGVVPSSAPLGNAKLAVAPSTAGDPATSRVYLLAGSSDDNAGEQRDLFRSDDGGLHFRALGVNASRAPVNPVEAPSNYSNRAALSQTDLNILKEQASYNQALVVDPRDPDLIFIGGQLTHARSQDGGASWALMGYGYPGVAITPGPLPYVHPDYHAMAISTGPAGATLWIGTDGGLTRSTDAFTSGPGKATYDDGVNVGRVTILPYALACAPESWPAAGQGYLITGLQDNGTRARVGNSTLFDPINGGDGVGVAVSMSFTALGPVIVPQLQLAGNFNRIVRSDNGADFDTQHPFHDGLGGPPASLPAFAVDVSAPNPRTFLTITDPPDAAVYRSVGGAAWQKIVGTVTAADGTTREVLSPPGAALGLRVITAWPKKTGVYAAASNRYTFITSDGGATWFNGNYVGLDAAKAPDGVSRLTGVAFDPSDATFSTLYAGSGAYVLLGGLPIPDTLGHVFRTTDKGVTWTALPGVPGARLPNVPVSALVIDHNDATGKTLYVGTHAGLYRTVDGGQHYSRFGTGLPLGAVTGVCLNESSSSIKVSMWGRGFWQVNTGASGNPAGVRGRGDMNHHLRLDGFDLIDFAATLGATQADDRYRAEADLVGSVNAIGDDDLTAFLARFGGTP